MNEMPTDAAAFVGWFEFWYPQLGKPFLWDVARAVAQLAAGQPAADADGTVVNIFGDLNRTEVGAQAAVEQLAVGGEIQQAQAADSARGGANEQ